MMLATDVTLLRLLQHVTKPNIWLAVTLNTEKDMRTPKKKHHKSNSNHSSLDGFHILADSHFTETFFGES